MVLDLQRKAQAGGQLTKLEAEWITGLAHDLIRKTAADHLESAGRRQAFESRGKTWAKRFPGMRG